MNILFLNGSPRKNGYTVRVMELIEEAIDIRHTVEWIHAYDLMLKPCQSCLQCRPGNECKLPKDDGHDVWHKIRSADALVMGSPTYFGNISGPLKTLVDRSLTAFETIAANGLEMPIPLHNSQKAIMVTACNAPFPISQLPTQSKATLQAMEIVLRAGGYDIVGSITLDGAAAIIEIPVGIQEKAKILGGKLVE